MAKRIRLFIIVIAVAILLETTTAQTTHVVGDSVGWLVPLGGPIAYATWAAMQTFTVGDIVVFNFVNGTQDVAMVTKEAYETCDTNKIITVLTTSPAKISLTTTGEHFFSSTYLMHCALGQKLVINVTASSTTTSPFGSTVPPSSTTTPSSAGSTAGGASSPVSSAPFQVVGGLFITFLSIAKAFF